MRKTAIKETATMPDIKLVAPKAPTSLIHKPINKTAVNPDSIEGMTPDTDRMVYGSFVNVETPGQPAKICGRYYRGMQYFEKTMEDNQKYEIPYSVARFINERCVADTHRYILDEKGAPSKESVTRARYKFIIER